MISIYTNGHFSWKKKGLHSPYFERNKSKSPEFYNRFLNTKNQSQVWYGRPTQVRCKFSMQTKKGEFFLFFGAITHTIATTQQHMPEQSSSRALGRATA
jgi:hypothetical protein